MMNQMHRLAMRVEALERRLAKLEAPKAPAVTSAPTPAPQPPPPAATRSRPEKPA